MNRLGGWFTRAEAGTEHPGSLSGPPGRPPSRRRARDDAMQTPGKDPWGDPQPGLEKRPALDPWGDPVRGASLCTRLVLADLPRPGPPTPPAAPRTHPLAPAPWPGSPGSGSRPVRSPRVDRPQGPGEGAGRLSGPLEPPGSPRVLKALSNAAEGPVPGGCRGRGLLRGTGSSPHGAALGPLALRGPEGQGFRRPSGGVRTFVTGRGS